MQNFYFSTPVDNDRTLCLAPLSERFIAASGQEITERGGYFLYERRASDPESVQIIAQVVSDEAALALRGLLNLV